MSTDPRTSNRASSRSVASTAVSVSKGSRGSVTGFSSSLVLDGCRAGCSAEDSEHSLGEQQVQAGDQRDDERHEDDDDGRVGDQLAAPRPDDLAQLGDDLAQEPADAAALPDLLRAGALGGGTRARPRPGGLAAGRPRGGARGAAAAGGHVVVLVVVGRRGDPATAAGRRRDDLLLLRLGLGGELVLGGLELGGVVHPGGLAVELLVGQLVEGVGGVVLAARLLVAHCASLASWWWRPGRAPRSVCSCWVAGVTGLEPAACGF